MIRVTFHGAAKTTTGSMHLLETDGARILFDCGLMQGRRKEAFETNRRLPMDPKSIDTVILSHAHIDHSGNLPSLIRGGFTGKIVATPATKDLCEIMLRDSAHIQEKDVEYVNKKRARQGKRLFEPLYVQADVEETLRRFVEVPYKSEFDIAPGAKMTFHDAGHILGSALTTVDFNGASGGKRLLFTGDMGRKDMPILRDPEVVHDVDWLITESTYGNRAHPPHQDVEGRLKGFVEDIQMQRARLIIPAFSVGRTQQIVYFLRDIYQKGRISNVPVFVDSPMSTRATEVYGKHEECFDSDAWRVLTDGDEPFQFSGIQYTPDVEDSKKLNGIHGPMIIISASGMCEAGRILHHLKNNVGNPRNIILIVGYQAEHTLGRRLVEHESPIKIFGEKYDVEARVHTINALSAHADRNEMIAYFKEMGPRVERAFCVHGEEEQTEAMAAILRELGARDVVVPEKGQSAELQ